MVQKVDDGEGDQGGDENGDDQEDADDETMNGTSNGNFSGSGDFNQMQMMMAMQNGMAATNSFGGFPMMGMLKC